MVAPITVPNVMTPGMHKASPVPLQGLQEVWTFYKPLLLKAETSHQA